MTAAALPGALATAAPAVGAAVCAWTEAASAAETRTMARKRASQEQNALAQGGWK